jgi:5'-methylthioadenosine phosphorylase
MMKVGIIGGSGFELPQYLSKTKKITAETPFGKPGSPLFSGTIDGVEIFHLARHGVDNKLPSVRVNHRANLFALMDQGCTTIITTTTCGSLREEICPGEFIVLDQFIDLTRGRHKSVFEDKKAGEDFQTNMTEPFSEDISDYLVEGAVVNGYTIHTRGTVVTIEGPRFSTRAESNLYRSWKADIINMTTAPEVIAANEFGISYAAVALCTGYDAWRTDTIAPSSLEIQELIKANTDKLMKIVTYAVKKLVAEEV